MSRLSSLSLAAFLGITACTPAAEIDGVKPEGDKYDASEVAVFVDLTFSAELITDSAWNPNQQIEDQLLYTIGLLNGENSVGRLDKVTLSDVKTTPDGTRTKISYRAKLPVAWGDKDNVPERFTLRLPRDMSQAALDRFTTSYSHSCVDFGAHDVDSGSMWYYYRPSQSGCRLATADIVTVDATVSASAVQTAGKFPEYDMLWADKAFNVVAIFGKYEDGATSGDAGITAYDTFVQSMKTELAQLGTVTTIPASIPTSPGVRVPDVEFQVAMAGGKTIRVNAMLTDNVRTALANETFRAKYEQLSTRADFIVYNGHAGLGSNVRALAGAGAWVAGQYVVVFMNGCDTFAYVDTALNDAHAEVNPGDTEGTRHVDIVVNAMPSFFHSMSGATMALFRGLIAADEPLTYEQIFRGVDRSQVILVTGEHDNQFVPGGGGETPTPSWPGLAESASLAKGAEKRFETPALPAGRYTFAITGSGDADLYVRVGSAPTQSTYDCRPYKTGSAESCVVELPQAAPVHVMVRGYTASSFQLSGKSN